LHKEVHMMNGISNSQLLIAQTNLGIKQRSLTAALEKLSSGIKINHAHENPSGFLMATQMAFNISGESTGINNLNMAVDLLNTADSFTRAIAEDVQRMADLASQASNALLTPEQRQSLQAEFSELNAEIDRLATNATYNGRPLLDGSLNGVVVQSGASPTSTVNLSIGNLTTGPGGLNTAALNISTVAGAQAAVAQLNTTVTTVLGPTVANIGAQGASWSKSTDAQSYYVANLQAARSRIIDTDVAEESTKFTSSKIMVKYGIAALSHANKAQLLALGLLA
jgi:flagellin